MGATSIKVSCLDQRLILTTAPVIASGGRNEDEIEFAFCPLWEGLEKVAIFYRDKDHIYSVLIDAENKCIIPWEVLADEGEFFFSVFGVKDDITRTSDIVKYKVVEGAITEATEPSDPTPDMYEQILAQLRANELIAQSAVDTADEVRDTLLETQEIANNAQIAASNAQTAASNAQTAASGALEAAANAAHKAHKHNASDINDGSVPIENGGTGATNAADALANLGAFRNLGDNVVSSPDNDKGSTWANIGSGYSFFSSSEQLQDQPTTWGVLTNIVAGTEVFQLWRSQPSGPTYWRSSNADGWYDGWQKVYDASNKPTPSDIGAATASHGHNLQDLSGTAPISKGGTGANNATEALANLGAFRFLGDNVISSTDNDTPSNWGALGSGYAFFSNGLLNDQPSTWGIVVSFVTGSDIFQMWRCQSAGPTYWRSGNASGWNGTWAKVYDTANTPALSDLAGQPTLSSTDVETVERTQYTYIGNMLVMSGITPEVSCAANAVTSYNVWFPKTFSTSCVVMASLYYNNDESGSAAYVNVAAGWYRNDTMVIKFSNTSGGARNLRASWLAIGM